SDCVYGEDLFPHLSVAHVREGCVRFAFHLHFIAFLWRKFLVARNAVVLLILHFHGARRL
uniref:Uncharacterized protein n=1 Tax=Parascaris univalens TaxID=6257 RepID=A0A914ZVK7_PARUN